MNSVLILGGAGYIGSVLTNKLINNNYNVTVYDRFYFGNPFKAKHNNLKLIRGDIRKTGADSELFKNIDAVIDLAGISNDPACDLNPRITSNINYDGCMACAVKAKSMGVKKYIYSSSCSVYGDSDEYLANESQKPNPISLYAKTKARCETALLQLAHNDFSITCLRNATAFGLSPRMRFDLIINLMTLHAYKTGRIYVLGGGKQWRPLVHVNDISRAIKLMIETDKNINQEIFNVGGTSNNYRVCEIATKMKRYFPDVELIYTPDDMDKRSYQISGQHIYQKLEFMPEYTVDDGICEIKNALIENLTTDSLNTYTVKYYQYLLEAEKVIKDVSINNRIF